ncbi:ABC transporter substrate-binding protein [Mycolicibacterium palauense]|uniref:ABC transporter substrate-binding protein n=1 Tax=Mycolicibacterium palauense TaxID=2034511 RepID=UPI000BFF0FD7|nr:ABC transporter substrate-binding protein [Mycolicibacterium palauense]
MRISLPPALGARRRKRTAAAAALSVMLLAAGCGGAGGGDRTTDGLVVLSPSQATSFAADGGATGGADGAELVMNTGAGLVRNPYVVDEASGVLKQDWYDFEPLLAEKYEVSPDGRTYTFTLRRGVLSQSGNELTADDVLWSYERKFASPGSAKFLNDPIITDPARQIAKVDDYTVTITIDDPGEGFTLLSLLANKSGIIYDSDLLKQHVTADDPYAVDWSKNNSGWGYGAYQVDRFTPGEETVLIANPNFVLGEPAVKKITYRVVTDPGTRVTALRSGDADVVTQLRPADQEALAADGAAKVFDIKTNLFNRLALITTNAPFDDQRVREALNYAIPYDRIIDSVYRGMADPTKGMLSPDAPGYDGTGITGGTYDPQKAKALLAEAGHPDGVEFTLTVSSAVPDMVETAVQIQSFAKDAGFTVNIDEQPASAFGSGSIEGIYQSFLARDYSAVMSPPYELSVWTGKGSNINYSRWEDESFYAAVAAGIAVGDPLTPEAGARWNAAERIMQKASPMIFIARVRPSVAFSKNTDGYAYRSDNTVDYSQVTLGSQE